jgi:hypothetical protein
MPHALRFLANHINQHQQVAQLNALKRKNTIIIRMSSVCSITLLCCPYTMHY